MLSFGMNQSWKVPIATLRVFEAAARWQSFHAAALELNLTPSAVSHSIRKMEEALGLLLFERVGRGVALSSEGQTLLGYIERGFDEILRGLDAVSTRAPRLLRLHCAPSFAAQWLTPRLGRFLAQHSDVEVRLSASVDYGRFDTGEFDADLMYGHPRQEGLVVLPLKEETVTPLCAPHLAGEIESPADPSRRVTSSFKRQQTGSLAGLVRRQRDGCAFEPPRVRACRSARHRVAVGRSRRCASRRSTVVSRTPLAGGLVTTAAFPVHSSCSSPSLPDPEGL